MRLTFVMGFFLPVPPIQGGAIEKIWFRLGSILARNGHAVTIVSRRWPGFPDDETRDGIRHIRVEGKNHTRWLAVNLWRDFRWGRRVLGRLPEGDVVVCNTVSLPIFLKRARPDAGRVAVALGRMPKGQVRTYSAVDLLLAISEAVANKARRENPRVADRVVCFPHAIDWPLHRDASRQAPAPAPVQIGYAGRIHPEKGLETLLEAGALLAERPRLPPWQVTLIGPSTVPLGGGGGAYLRQLENRFRSKLGNRLVIRPPLFDPVELARCYGEFHLFCYPSVAARGEGLGIAPLEAMAAGAVPIVSRLDCFRDMIRHEDTGFQFDHTRSNAPKELTEILARLIEEPRLRAEVAARAQAEARRYDFDEAAGFLAREFARLTGSSEKT